MITYNPKEWYTSVVHFHQSDTFRKLFPYLILMSIYSGGIAYFELEYLQLSSKSWLKEITTVHSLLGFVISMLLVFRTNSAYDRWWEGRKQWGTLTNVSRAFAIKINGILARDDEENRKFFKETIPMYAKALFSFLRSDYSTFMLDEHSDFQFKVQEKHAPNQVANYMNMRISELYQSKLITGDQLILLDKELIEFTNICGACERIKNTPIPFSYSAFIKKFIVLYVLTLPVGLVFSMGYFVVLAVPFIFYVLASMELIAEMIEEPFGNDPDDLPIEQITKNIEKNVLEIFD